MDFFDDINKVRSYIDMARGYDGRELIEKLSGYLPAGATVLELGMGPGVDMDILRGSYKATGSDASSVFLDLYREKHPDADVLQLDAVELATERRFDCIYSNKVLHHLRREDVASSLARQQEVLTDGGLVCHSFWNGSGEETHEGLRFVYYSEDEIRALFEPTWKILEVDVYTEMEEGDSILLIARKR